MPRVPPKPVAELPDDLREEYEKNGALKIHPLLCHSPDLARTLQSIGVALAKKTAITLMDRELIVLATTHFERGAYEWSQNLYTKADA